jgi:predicted O-linked N-acetylglucosamine transferase (SPINDLY family)
MQDNTPAAIYAQAFDAYRQSDLQGALRLLGPLLQAHPGHADGWNLCGVIYTIERGFNAATACFARAIAAGAGAGTLVNLGFAHQKLEQREQAGRAYRQALRQDPSLAIAWQKLGGLEEIEGRPERALDCYRRAAQLDPTDLKSLGDALFLRRHLADWSGDVGPTPDALLAAYAGASRSDFPPLLLLALPEAAADSRKDAARKFAQSQWATALASPPLAPAATTLDGRRLRIGYLSSDFRDHPVSYLALETIAAHDRNSAEVFLYAHGQAAPLDEWRKMAIAAADHFVDLDALGDHAAAGRIAGDGIDVLVDLNGYTADARMGIVAQRPAPVIASWLGYIGTLGEPRLVDYVIGDAVATPMGIASQFSESLALMPHCFQPGGRLETLPPPPSRSSQGLPEQGLVFCSFNQTFKLHPALWDDWCEILRQVPGSVLWLAPPRDEAGQRNLRAESERRGVDPARLVFAAQQPRTEHMARLALADLALDTYPYNSGTTASDALRAGVPLLAFPGDTFVSRMAASLLSAAGMPECIARDRQDYVALAVRMGTEASLRDHARQRLRENLRHSALFKPQVFANDLERLYRAMHARKLAGTRGPVQLATDNASAGQGV